MAANQPHMKRLLYILIIIPFISGFGFKNSPNLVGKWTLKKMIIPQKVYYDVDNLDSTYSSCLNYFYNIKNNNPNSSKIDSTQFKQKITKTLEDMQQVYFQFDNKNSYKARQTNHKGVTNEIVTGTYEFNVETKVLIMIEDTTNRKDELKVILISEQELILTSEYEYTDKPFLYFKRTNE